MDQSVKDTLCSIAEHLAKQGQRSTLYRYDCNTESSYCRYLTPDGRSCPVGFLLLKQGMSTPRVRQLPDKQIDAIASYSSDVKMHLLEAFPGVVWRILEPFLLRLQRYHDQYTINPVEPCYMGRLELTVELLLSKAQLTKLITLDLVYLWEKANVDAE